MSGLSIGSSQTSGFCITVESCVACDGESVPFRLDWPSALHRREISKQVEAKLKSVGDKSRNHQRVFLLTRFSIRPDSELEDFLPRASPPAYKNADWLQQRLKQMVRYTIPSVSAQTDQDFGWLIGVDKETPPSITEALQNELPPTGRLLVSDAAVSYNERVRQFLLEQGRSLTIRLDSDDALDHAFVSKARSAKLLPGEALNFPHGVALYEQNDLIVHKFIPSNPFIVYFGLEAGEHGLELGTHSQIGSTVAIRNVVTARPMWLKLYGASATSKAPPNGLPVLGRSSRVLNRLTPGLGSSIAEPTVTAKVTSLVGFLGRSIARRLPIVDEIYRLCPFGPPRRPSRRSSR